MFKGSQKRLSGMELLLKHGLETPVQAGRWLQAVQSEMHSSRAMIFPSMPKICFHNFQVP